MDRPILIDNTCLTRTNLPNIARSPVYPEIPFRMVVFGPSGSGKTSFVNMLVGSNVAKELRFHYDFLGDFGYRACWPRTQQIDALPQLESGVHGLFIYEDPPFHQAAVIYHLNDTFRTCRKKGISTIMIAQSDKDLSKDTLRSVIEQANMFVFTRQGAEAFGGKLTRLKNLLNGREDLAKAVIAFPCRMDSPDYCLISQSRPTATIKYIKYRDTTSSEENDSEDED